MTHKTGVATHELRHKEPLQSVEVPEQIKHSFAVAEFVRPTMQSGVDVRHGVIVLKGDGLNASQTCAKYAS